MTVAYVLSRFPLLSETFILREMVEVERQGDKVCVFALRQVRGPMHPRLQALRAEITCPGWWELRTHARWLRRRPLRYLRTLAEVLIHNWGDRNLWLGAVAYWGKAVAMAEHIERRGVDRVHAHYATHPAMAAYVVRRLTGVPYSFTVHAHDVLCHQAMLGRKARAADVVVAISELNRGLVERALALEAADLAQATPVEVVHCGVELDDFTRLTCAPHKDGEALRVLAVGSLQPYKGHAVLVAACGRLRAQEVNFRCRIVGGGPLRRALEQQIAGLGLEAAVELSGAATESEVLHALAWADVVAMPSVRDENSGQMEGIPVAMMEAMAAGLPVVASRLSGIPELVSDGVEGQLVAPGDDAALAAALAAMTDAGTRLRLGAAGRRKVAQAFALGANVAQLRRLWRVAAGAPGHVDPPAVAPAASAGEAAA